MFQKAAVWSLRREKENAVRRGDSGPLNSCEDGRLH